MGCTTASKKRCDFLHSIFGIFIGDQPVRLSKFRPGQLSTHGQVLVECIGTGYMIYLGIHIALTKSAEQGEIKLSLNTFKAGAFMQFLNLKLILYGITVFSNFIIPFHQDS